MRRAAKLCISHRRVVSTVVVIAWDHLRANKMQFSPIASLQSEYVRDRRSTDVADGRKCKAARHDGTEWTCWVLTNSRLDRWGKESDGVQQRSNTSAYRALLRRRKIPNVPFYNLRHSHASQLLRSGVSPRVISERLGHAKVGFTLDVYAHLLPGMQEEAALRVESRLGMVLRNLRQRTSADKRSA